MTKKYGSFGGSAPEPSADAAVGGWNNAEVYRQRELNKWPDFFAAPRVPTSSIVYAVSSGVVFDGVNDNSFLVPSGQPLSRTDFAPLFDTIGTTFGSGDGSTTFNLPDYRANFERCLKYVTDSGRVQNGQQVSNGVFPYHNHTANGGQVVTINAGNRNDFSDRPAGRTNINLVTTTAGDQGGNSPKRRYLAPLIATSGFYQRTGMVVPFIAGSADDVIQQFPPNMIVPTGQELLRSEYPELFTLIGIEYGSGNGTTTFDVPDLRGVFPSLPYPDLTLPSGAQVYPDIFCLHQHQQNNVPVHNLGTKRTGGGTRAVIPNGGGSLGNAWSGTESRPTNYCAIFCLVASPSKE